jgi:hypothetical protein
MNTDFIKNFDRIYNRKIRMKNCDYFIVEDTQTGKGDPKIHTFILKAGGLVGYKDIYCGLYPDKLYFWHEGIPKAFLVYPVQETNYCTPVKFMLTIQEALGFDPSQFEKMN